MTNPNTNNPSPNWGAPFPDALEIPNPMPTVNILTTPPTPNIATAPANFAPPTPNTVTPNVLTLNTSAAANQLSDPDELGEVFSKLEDILPKSFLESLSDKIEELEENNDDFIAANETAPVTPDGFKSVRSSRKMALMSEFTTSLSGDEETSIPGKAEAFKPMIAQEAIRIVDERFTNGLKPGDKGLRVAAVKGLLTETLKPTLTKVQGEATIHTKNALQNVDAPYESDPDYLDEVERLKLEASDVLWNGRDDEPGLYDMLEAIEGLGLNKRNILGKSALKGSEVKDIKLEQAAAILNDMNKLIKSKLNELGTVKSVKLAKWLAENKGTGIDEVAAKKIIEDNKVNFEKDVRSRFFNKDNLDYVVATVIEPNMRSVNYAHLVEKEILTGNTQKTGGNTEPRLALLKLVKDTEVADLNAYIGKFKSAGGKPEDIAEALAVAEEFAKDPDTRLQFIKDTLQIPTK